MDEVEREQENFQKKGSKSKIIIIILLILVIVAVAAVAAYFFLFNTPRKAFDKDMQSVSKFMEEKIVGSLTDNKFVYDRDKVLETDMKLYGEVTTGGDSYYTDEVKEINDLIKNVKFDIKHKLDVKNESMYAYLGLEENNKIAISGEAFLNRDIVMGILKDISDNYFYVKTADMDEETKTAINSVFDALCNPNEDYKEISKEYIELVKNSIGDEQYKKENTVIKIDGNDTKVTKTSLVITEKEFKVIVKNLLEKVKTDDRVLDLIISSTGTGYYTPEGMKSQLIKSLDQAIEEINNMELELNLVVSAYKKGNTLVQFEVELALKADGEEITANIVMNCADENNINILFKVKYDSFSYEFTLDIVKDGNKTTATLDLGRQIGKVVYEVVKVSDSREESKIEYIQSGTVLLAVKCNTDYYTNTKNEMSRKDEFIVDVNVSGYPEDKISVRLVAETRLSYTDGVQVPSVGKDDIDLINQEVPYEFLEKLETKLNEIQFVRDIMTLYNSNNSSYDYGVNDDYWDNYNEDNFDW